MEHNTDGSDRDVCSEIGFSPVHRCTGIMTNHDKYSFFSCSFCL